MVQKVEQIQKLRNKKIPEGRFTPQYDCKDPCFLTRKRGLIKKSSTLKFERKVSIKRDWGK